MTTPSLVCPIHPNSRDHHQPVREQSLPLEPVTVELSTVNPLSQFLPYLPEGERRKNPPVVRLASRWISMNWSERSSSKSNSLRQTVCLDRNSYFSPFTRYLLHKTSGYEL